MLLREGVILAGLQPEMRLVKKHAGRIWSEHGQECVIVSALDREHSDGSLHPFGYALDLRTSYFNSVEAGNVARELREALGDKYQVVVEGTHIHVEYDPN